MPAVVANVRRLPTAAAMVAIAAEGNVSEQYEPSVDNLLLDVQGRVWPWRINSNWALPGAVGPAPLALPKPATAIETTYDTQLALLADGSLLSWGSQYAWSARPAGPDAVPTLVPGVGGLVALDAGGSGVYARTGDGALLGWGDLGATARFDDSYGPKPATSTPHPVAIPSSVGALVSAAIGRRYSAALVR